MLPSSRVLFPDAIHCIHPASIVHWIWGNYSPAPGCPTHISSLCPVAKPAGSDPGFEARGSGDRL
jgi:hypothetical protein